MIPSHAHPSDRAFGEHRSPVLQSVGTHGWLAPSLLAAEDHSRARRARAEQDRRLAEAGMPPRGIRAVASSLQEATGSVLIRFGKRLRGAPVPAGATGKVPLA